MEPLSNSPLRTNAQHPGPVDRPVLTPGAQQTQMRNRHKVAIVALQILGATLWLGGAAALGVISFKAALIVGAATTIATLLMLGIRPSMPMRPRAGVGQPSHVHVTRIVPHNPSGSIPVVTPGADVNASGRSSVPNPRVPVDAGAGVGNLPGHAAWAGAGNTSHRPEVSHRGAPARFIPVTQGESRGRPVAGVSPVVVTGTRVERDPNAPKRG